MSARAAFLGATAAYALAFLVAVARLPDRVPLHFDGGGQVDRWGDRATALVLLAVLGVAMTLLFEWTAGQTDRIRIAWLNVPHQDWWTATPERESVLRARMSTDLWVIGALTMALLTVVEVSIVVAAHTEDPALGWPFFVALAVYLVAVLGYTALARPRYRPTEVSRG